MKLYIVSLLSYWLRSYAWSSCGSQYYFSSTPSYSSHSTVPFCSIQQASWCVTSLLKFWCQQPTESAMTSTLFQQAGFFFTFMWLFAPAFLMLNIYDNSVCKTIASSPEKIVPSLECWCGRLISNCTAKPKFQMQEPWWCLAGKL